jgi:hypothetical protein
MSPCERVGAAIVCSRAPRVRFCAYCRAPHAKLCDHVLPNGRTCDKPLCLTHAHHVAPDLDYCPAHKVFHLPSPIARSEDTAAGGGGGRQSA